jgi:hypothetical protein
MTTTLRRIITALVATVLLVASGLFAQSAGATPANNYNNPSLTASPSSGRAGSGTTVHGDHFTPGQTVTLTFHSAVADLGTATVGADGTFDQDVTIPSDATIAGHKIWADDSLKEHAEAPFTVTSKAAGGVTVSNPTPTAGGSITVSGQGCTPDATITVTLDGTTPLGTTTASDTGAYSVRVKIPSDTSPGSHQIVVEGAGCSGTLGITVQAPGGLAGTGVAVIGIGALGVVLLVGGGLMLLAGRRRRVTSLI